MTLLPVGLTLVAAVLLGLVLGVQYLRRIRRPMVIGVHVLCGIGALEQLVIQLHGTPGGDVTPYGRFGDALALLLVGSIASGFISALLVRHSKRVAEAVLVTHALVGAAGFGVFLVWVM